MARGVNRVTLIGNLGQEPELRYTGSGTAVCNMRLATNESYTNRDGEEVQRTEWHRIVAWGRLGEICDEYLEKGSQVYFEGKLQTNEWEDRDGNQRETTEIRAQEVMFLDSNRQGPSGGDGFSQERPQEEDLDQTRQEQPAGPPGASGTQQSGQSDEEEETFEPDDDLPF